MARPRVFISSTYYDLRVVRADLERFISREVGYEAVLFERGHIPYTKEASLEDSCYREINGCDILVAIIGGKYGSTSADQKHSITQRELKTAIELGKQIYVFVESLVHNEYETYKLNKDVEGFKPASVNDVKVFSILDEIHALPMGNPITAFEVSEDIVHFLREQWSGLFQRLLQEASRQKEINTIQNLQETASTLKQLVTYLTEEKTQGDKAIKDILLSSHPAFLGIKKAANIPYRVSFHNMKELDSLLSTRGYKRDTDFSPEGHIDWDSQSNPESIRVKETIFEKDGKLKIITPDNWKEEWIKKVVHQQKPNDFEDEIPF